MPVTIRVNGTATSLVHKGSNGISAATMPDVCKTPSPGGPVPLPYPNISQSATLDKGTTSVSADGGMMIAIKGSEFSLSNGDNPGVAGGVKSNTFMKESTWLLYSFDVKMDGENACRLTDKKLQNHENTADMCGETQPGVGTSTPDCIVGTYDEIKDKCPAGHQAHHIVPDYCARTGSRAAGMAGENRIPGMPSFGGGPAVCLEGNARSPGSGHNLAHQCDKEIAAFGREHVPEGTAPAAKVIAAAVDAAVAAVAGIEGCGEKVRAEAERAYAGVGPEKSMRTTQKLSAGQAKDNLKAGGVSVKTMPSII
jgi:hypothetical protein